MKTYLYSCDPLKPHFYIAKLGFTGVYIIFLISAQNIDCWYSLEPPHQNFYLKTFSFLVVKFSIYLNRRVFVIPVSAYWGLILGALWCIHSVVDHRI